MYCTLRTSKDRYHCFIETSFLAITLNKKYFVKEFPPYWASLFLSMHCQGGKMTVVLGDIEANDFLNW